MSPIKKWFGKDSTKDPLSSGEKAWITAAVAGLIVTALGCGYLWYDKRISEKKPSNQAVYKQFDEPGSFGKNQVFRARIENRTRLEEKVQGKIVMKDVKPDSGDCTSFMVIYLTLKINEETQNRVKNSLKEVEGVILVHTDPHKVVIEKPCVRDLSEQEWWPWSKVWEQVFEPLRTILAR